MVAPAMDPATPNRAASRVDDVAGGSVEALLHRVEQRCHALWTTEPDVPLEQRRRLMDALGDIEAAVSAISLAVLHQPGDTAGDLQDRVHQLERRVASLETAWQLPAA